MVDAGRRVGIELLGGLRVTFDGAPVAFRLRKSAALVAYLATEGRPVRRAALCTLLWEDMAEARALANLRTVLHDAARALPGCLSAGTDEVALGPATVDRTSFDAAVAAVPGGDGAQAERAAAALLRYSGPFLEGFQIEAAPDFDDFVSLERQRLQQAAESLAELVAADRLARSTAGRNAVARPAAPLVGRDDELAAVESLLAGGRLVSLVGTGGVGKTRLAHEVAFRAQETGWAAMVDLSGIDDPKAVPAAIADELGLPLSGLRPPLDEVLTALERTEGLVLLDNLEQLLPGSIDVVIGLLRRCPALRLLVTSRTRLQVQAEQVVTLRPLPITDPGAAEDTLGTSPAVRLFVARARAAGAGDQLDDVATIARLCAAFDGLPLAIELAAARCRLLSPAEVLGGLRSVLDAVGGSPRDLPERQRTLRDSLTWSSQLLSDHGRIALESLGTFRGGAPLAALVAVAGLGEDDGLSAALELVDAGLAERSTSAAGSRLTVLDSTRTFAAELLAADRAAAAYRRRHAVAFVDFVRAAERGLRGPGHREWALRYATEVDNVRQALQYAIGAGDAELALELASGATRYWYLRGLLGEGREWLGRSLSLPGPPEGVADHDSHRRLVGLQGRARLDLVLLAILQDPAEQLAPLVDQAEAELTRVGDELGLALVADYRGMLFNSRDPSVTPEETARVYAGVSRALATFESAGDRWNAARLRWLSSHYALSMGDPAGAVDLAREAERAFHDLGDQLGRAQCRSWLGILVGLTDDYGAAEPFLSSAFAVQHDLGDVIRGSHSLTALACMRAGLGHSADAARLFGACAAIEDRFGVRLPPAYEPLVVVHRQMARDALTPEEWATAFDLGYTAGFDVITEGAAAGR